ncbi:hypothetical protein [Pseudomonas matsuisoli]|uniref:Glycosyl transferase family 28 C-terminal domain-containing protein n=1 Tax=Pseudomonas matsuisoli TaxID=1515666 RepID=A0A917UWZ1_9PSED|nr:hypothetical protein [Pseudomonas matsuisoli]GGJ91766.1 hypothetical protein GCM10009304_16960 [Pseudomonas matsuisoli]
MRECQIGYYVHHQGAGHLTRALAIAPHLQRQVTLIGSSVPDVLPHSSASFLRLPMDVAPDMHVESFETLHYAPLAVDGLRERMGMLGTWFQQNWPCVLVVDVSVEVATFARLFGVPTIYIRQHGRRDDGPHRQAYAMATRLLAPYPRAMEGETTPDDVIAKTDHVGWVSRYSPEVANASQRGRVLVINGRGGTAFDYQGIAALAEACPEWTIRVAGELGGVSARDLPPNLHCLGRLHEPLEEMRKAEIIIGSTGDSLVSECAALGRRFIGVAEDRPYEEQRLQARRLNTLGVAIGLQSWPAANEWPALLDKARALPIEPWQALVDVDAPKRAAAAIEAVADSLFGAPPPLPVFKSL